ncbi:peptidase dimerization domain-containing protein [Dictyobacter formicarum]|uniref:Peptidase M20 dimerisation domain-containing protein n=1 Tax=Dictyobacter formicarum TaxID=2778368 RepID=A0ABQ3VTR9_9CHLR|nr:peptidase dimerization domain-containing protein [Dictyobacter formicarum]GHO89089.1 hypothetical protein KSZ_70950 [Dictyobacter formicarum]
MPLSSIQQILLHTIDEQFPLYLHDWQSISTQIYTSPAPKIQDIWLSLLRHHGFLVQYLDPDQLILYGEYMVQAPQTLLFYIKYTPSMAMQQVTFPLLSQLAAIHAYANHCKQFPVNIKWLIDGQASTPSTYLAQLLAEQRSLLQADSCILYTTKREISKVAMQTELILGIKGHLQVEVSLQTATRAIPASYGAIAPDAAWQLIWALAALKDEREDILLEGFYDHLQTPEDEVIEAISHLPDISAELRQAWGTEQLVMDLKGIQQHYAYWLTPTCTITLLNSALSPQTSTSMDDTVDNTELIPTQAQARLDFQLVPAQNPHEIFTKLQHHFHTHTSYPVQCRLLSASQPIAISAREPMVQQWQQAIQNVSQQPPLLLPLAADVDEYTLISRQFAVPTMGIALPIASVATGAPAPLEQLRAHMKQHVLFLTSYDRQTPDHANRLSSH